MADDYIRARLGLAHEFLDRAEAAMENGDHYNAVVQLNACTSAATDAMTACASALQQAHKRAMDAERGHPSR